MARLKRRPEFLRVARTRQKWVAPGLIVQARRHTAAECASADLPPVRVGFTASRKVGNAVARNRTKRRLRAAVTHVVSAHAADGFDFVVIGRAATRARPFADLLQDLETALKKLGAYRKTERETATEGQAETTP